jgi:PiT family inorganic phosphate transporter
VLQLLAPIYLGWSLGANDASNVFGTAVASRMVRFATAAALGSVFVLLGALLEGGAGMRTLATLSPLDTERAVVVSLGAAVTVTLMTLLRLPVSTSQAVVGAIVGVGLFQGGVETGGLAKVVLCWVTTPLGALVAAVVLYRLLRAPANWIAHRLVTFDLVMRAGLVIAGCYGSYALGANNAANVTGVFVGSSLMGVEAAALVAGSSIALGIVTYSKPVMLTVGRGIIRLNAYSALVVVLAEAVTVHLYAVIGVPVSTSQAVVGAVLGVGLLKSVETVRFRAVLGVLSGWIATPAVAAACAVAIYFVSRLRFAG